MDNITNLASTRVFGIVELLENILIFAEVFDLFVIQRVNSTFRDVVASSPSLREAMHLWPEAAANIIDFDSRLELLYSKNVKEAITPFEIAKFVKSPCASIQRLKVTIPNDYRRKETRAGRTHLEFLRLTNASWKGIQIGTTSERLELWITSGGRWPATSKLTIEMGADLGCVVKAGCECVTEYWRSQRYIASLSPWQRLIQVVETNGGRRDDTRRDLVRA